MYVDFYEKIQSHNQKQASSPCRYPLQLPFPSPAKAMSCAENNPLCEDGASTLVMVVLIIVVSYRHNPWVI